MNLRQYAEAQAVQDAPAPQEEQEPVKKGKRLKVTISNHKPPTPWGKDIIELNNEGYAIAVLAQLSLLQDYIQVQDSEEYWQAVVDAAGNITRALSGTPAGELATKLTVATVEYLEEQYKKNK